MRGNCTEREMRAGLSDAEFWEHVFPDTYSDSDPYQPDPNELRLEPCPHCHSTGACAYDAEGLPLIHAISMEDDL